MTPHGTKMRRVLVWFRRDLRVADNPALVAALQMAEEVVPVFIWAPEEEGQFQPGRCLRWWLHSSLKAFEADLAALGSRMVYAKAAESRIALAALVRDLGAQGVLFNHLYDPISMVRDNEVKAAMAAQGVFCQSFSADILREPWEVLDPAGQPFTCFEDFWNAHCSLPYPPPAPLPVPPRLPPVPAELGGLALGELGMMLPEEEMSNVQLEYHWTPGGAGAHAVLMAFLQQRLASFDRDRAKTDRNSTSRLSPHIHCGEVSVRAIYYLAKQKEAEWASTGVGGSSVADFLRQVGYREYSRYLSFHFPFTHERSLLEHLRAVPWKFDQRLFKAWRQGRTGYPLVDAGMRELWSTGWMHNRIRVVAASFMVKNLLLPWQWGLKHYWDAQLDADLESDALGWQYCAGCMADAHDFGYMMDLGVESKRFDPDGNYVRRWLPVLARLPAKYIHAPWEAPVQILEDAGVELGVNYPLPVISQQESAADLAKADAIVQQCQRGEGGGEVGGVSWPRGPFRPPTEPSPALAAAAAWGHAAAGGGEEGQSVLLPGGGGGRRRRPYEGDSGEASEEVQSNIVAMDEVSEVHAPAGGRRALAPARAAWQAAAAGKAAAAAAAEAEVEAEAEEQHPAEPSAPWPAGPALAEMWVAPAPAGVAKAAGTAGGTAGTGTNTRPSATDFQVPSLSGGPSGARVPNTAAAADPHALYQPAQHGQNSTEAAQQDVDARGQGATSPLGGATYGGGTTSLPTVIGRRAGGGGGAGGSSWCDKELSCAGAAPHSKRARPGWGEEAAPGAAAEAGQDGAGGGSSGGPA